MGMVVMIGDCWQIANGKLDIKSRI